jgi:hypothetical protein
MILTDISGKIKRIPDISPRIFAMLALLLTLLGVFFAYSIFEREYARKGSLSITQNSLGAEPVALLAKEASSTVTEGKYVASRSGSFYYLPTCSGAKRIKDKNKVWFVSHEDAEARGLKPSTNCPGLVPAK